MDKVDKLIEYYTSERITKLSAKDRKGLSNKEIAKIQSAIDLNLKLKSIRVSENFGKESFRNILNTLEQESSKASGKYFIFSRFSLVSLASSALLIALIAGGFSLFGINNSNNANVNTDKISSLTAEGNINSLNTINLADVETENSQLQNEANTVSSVKSNMVTSSNINEEINENF